jgi:signal transduction histidine kinase
MDQVTRVLGAPEMLPVEVDVTAVAWDAFAGLGSDRAGRDVRIRVEPLPVAYGDPSILEAVLTRLLALALRYTGGCRPAEIFVGSRDGAYFVSDNGTGIDSGDTEAAGVLAFTARILAEQGGCLWTDSLPGIGATYFFTLEDGRS